MWDSLTHVKNVTIGEPKRKIYTMDIIVSDTVTHNRNVTRRYIFRFLQSACLYGVGLCDTC